MRSIAATGRDLFDDRVSQQPDRPRLPFGRPACRRRALRIWFGVEQHRHQVRAGDAVDHAVMHFREQGPPAISEPFDDPHLPQRLRAVEIL